MNFESEKKVTYLLPEEISYFGHHIFCCKYLYKILYACDCNVDFDIN